MTARRAPLPFALAALVLAAGAGALHGRQPVPPGAARVLLDAVPPAARPELFGPGPCRPHGSAPTSGWTDAVAGPPPKVWRETR